MPSYHMTIEFLRVFFLVIVMVNFRGNNIPPILPASDSPLLAVSSQFYFLLVLESLV